MIENLKRLNELLSKCGFPFYLERNDFEPGGISIEEEIGDLIRSGDIGEGIAANMLATQSIWSARFYHGWNNNDRNPYQIVYAATLEIAIDRILKKLEAYV
jgi:hypothetical protein